MKRLLSILLITVALIFSVTGCTVSERSAEAGIQQGVSLGKNTSSDHFYLEAKKNLLSEEQEVTHSYYNFGTQYPSKPIHPYSPNALRQKLGELQIRRLYCSILDKFELKASIVKANGYYLYHLCKLLI